MTEYIKDFDNYFIGSDITVNATQWKQEGRDYWIIFLPLEPDNKPQSCLQKIGNQISRLDFLLREIDNKLVFNDITTKKGWYLDLTELSQSKIHLVGEYSKATFLKEPILNVGFSL